jgi:hypothetical protein
MEGSRLVEVELRTGQGAGSHQEVGTLEAGAHTGLEEGTDPDLGRGRWEDRQP